jgi:hypothetical protein
MEIFLIERVVLQSTITVLTICMYVVVCIYRMVHLEILGCKFSFLFQTYRIIRYSYNINM